jgi:hypothetical protein
MRYISFSPSTDDIQLTIDIYTVKLVCILDTWKLAIVHANCHKKIVEVLKD